MPPASDDVQKVIIKVVSGDGCRGCDSCEPEEGENEGEAEGEISLEGEPLTEGEVLIEGEPTEGEFHEGEDEILPEGKGEVSVEGEGETIPEGEGENTEGEGVYVEGEIPAEGEELSEGEGEITVEGEGEVPAEGEVLTEGEGEVLTEGEGEPEKETILLPGDVPLEMVRVPEGSFMMGRYPGELDSWSDEDPQHSVTVPGFWLGKTEVTKARWQALMDSTPWLGADYVLDEPDSPAVYLSWYDAKDFIRALNIHTGQTFRLPSEAEWEYACRAGTTTRFYWGDDPSYTEGGAYCWWYDNAYAIGEDYAHVVGLKLPNGFGLYDMSGNVWEWCEDDWHSSYTGAPADGSAWVSPPRDSYVVSRGGSWSGWVGRCRSAHRGPPYPTIENPGVGFRLSR